MEFKYKGWQVEVEKDPWMGYYKWSAEGPSGQRLGDHEGGELGSMSNAKTEIKRWLDEYMNNPFEFGARYPELVPKNRYLL